MLAVTPMVTKHRLGIEHTLLLGGQLGIEGLSRLAMLNHLGMTHLRHGKHLVQTLRRVQLFELASHSLPVHALTHSRLADADKGVLWARLAKEPWINFIAISFRDVVKTTGPEQVRHETS
nr:hypothetical protein [Thiobacillus denitrificans]